MEEQDEDLNEDFYSDEDINEEFENTGLSKYTAIPAGYTFDDWDDFD